ncbi:MAG: Methionine aminopeptidase [Candidatus Woesearchaeota archaeon]|nr:Methionine aminopeptidase [Candidatus Woesearchaeota archaeon]
MDKIQKYEKAGKIAAEALAYGKKLIKQKSYLLDVTKKIEDYINKKAEIAFPIQISMDNVAAHFYPDHDDEIIFEDQVCKLDVGVHVDGFVGDNAVTVDLSGKHTKLVKASREALDNAIKVVKAGVQVGEIGKVIQDTITGYGFAPIRNLSGHGLDEYNVHTPPNIPNTATGDTTTLEEGDVVAIEPFASTGAGIVIETSNPTLFQLVEPKPVRDRTTRKILQQIINYNNLPFAKRWLVNDFPLFKVNFALKRMLDKDIISSFPPLADKAKGIVSQAEYTVVVEKNGCRILTKV